MLITGSKFYAYAHLLLGSQSTNWTPWHEYLGHSSVHKIPKFKIIAPKSNDTGPKVHAHAHVPLMGDLHTHWLSEYGLISMKPFMGYTRLHQLNTLIS